MVAGPQKIGLPARRMCRRRSHMHGDHVCDLFNLFMFGATAVHGSRPGIKDTVQVIGPGPTAGSRGGFEPYGPPPFAGVGGLLEHGYAGQAATLTAWAMGQGNLRDLIDLHEIEDRGSEPFTVLDNGEVTVRAVTVPHLPASYAYRQVRHHIAEWSRSLHMGSSGVTPSPRPKYYAPGWLSGTARAVPGTVTPIRIATGTAGPAIPDLN